jgi:hypothetical protein
MSALGRKQPFGQDGWNQGIEVRFAPESSRSARAWIFKVRVSAFGQKQPFTR